MKTVFLPKSTDTRRFYLVLGALIALAWGLLAVWQRSAYAEMLGHEIVGHHGISPAWRFMMFLLSWSLMVVAMMLPGSLNVLSHYVKPTWHRAGSSRMAGGIILGYLSSWIFLFGLLVYMSDVFLHEMTEPAAPLAAFSDFIAPAIVMVAGVYQLTPFKRGFIRRCRTSHALLPQSKGVKISGTAALRQGMQLGILCIGSCWSLMLLMSALGHHRLDWMLALGGIMAAERLAPWGQRLASLVGLALIVWATFWTLL